jgi:predicted double-glycine peptidase
LLLAGVLVRPAFPAVECSEYADYGKIYPGGSSACGVSCLWLAARLHGIDADLLQVAESCALSLKDGVSMLALKRTAEKLGLQAAGYEYETSDWRSLAPPAIVHFKNNHFVLLLEVHEDRLVAADPPRQKVRRFSPQEFADLWDGYTLEIRSPKGKANESEAGDLVAQSDLVVDAQTPPLAKGCIDLGTVQADKSYQGKLTIRNQLDATLTITSITSTCGCVGLSEKNRYKGRDIRPSTTLDIPFTIDTRAMGAGPLLKRIAVELKSPAKSFLSVIDLKAAVFAEGRLQVYPYPVRIHQYSGRGGTSDKFTISRASREPVSLREISPSEAWLSAEAVSGPQNGDNRITAAVSILGELSIGKHDGELVIRTDHPQFKELKVPVHVEVEPGIKAYPATLFLENPQVDCRIEVLVVSLTENDVQVTGVMLQPFHLDVTYTTTAMGRGKQKVLLQLRIPERPQEGVIRAIVSVRTAENGTIDIPLVILNRPKPLAGGKMRLGHACRTRSIVEEKQLS